MSALRVSLIQQPLIWQDPAVKLQSTFSVGRLHHGARSRT
jgi:hypothetical protein